MVANQEMPSKSQAAKQPKSIDRICAELQLTADGGVEAQRKFVDIDDVIGKQNHQSEGLNKNFDSDRECGTSTARVANSCDVQPNKVSPSESGDMITTNIHGYVETSTRLIDVHSTNKMVGTDVFAGVSDSSTGVYTCEVDDKKFFSENRVQEQTSMDTIQLQRSQQSVNKMADQRNEEEKRKVVPRHATQYNNWHYTDMLKAINAVQTKNMSMTAAAKRFQIPRTTLRHYLNDGTNREPKLACFSLPKELEEELLQFVLDNRDRSEKELYKLIFEKARTLSQVLSDGMSKKRHAPTPAWIRRFVYRHKQLHDLFPTCLTSEHPLHGGRKTPHDLNDMNMSYDGDNSISPTHDVEEKCEPYTFLTRRNDAKGQSYVSEIIFPQSVYDKTTTTFNSSEHLHTSDEYSHESEMSHDDYDGGQSHHEDFDARQRVGDRKCFSNFSMIGDEKSPRNVKFDSNLNHVICPITKSFSHPVDQVHLSVSHPTPIYNPKESDARHDSRERYFKKSVKMDNRFLVDESFPHHGRHLSLSHNTPSPMSADHVFSNSSNARYDKASSRSKPGLNGFNESGTNGVKMEGKCGTISELHVCEALLVAMENSIGHDFVQLFQERYSTNRTIERLYSQWVRLKTDVELQLQPPDGQLTGDGI